MNIWFPLTGKTERKRTGPLDLVPRNGDLFRLAETGDRIAWALPCRSDPHLETRSRRKWWRMLELP